MKRFYISLFTLFTTTFACQGLAETLPSPAAVRELTDKVIAKVVASSIEDGIRLLKPFSINPEAEIEAAIGQAKLQVPMISQRYGKVIGHEFIQEEKIGDSLIKITHIVKFEKHPMRWTFFFYKGNDGWVMNTFFFDDNIRAIFSN